MIRGRWLVDGAAGDSWSELSLPTGTDMLGWIRIDQDVERVRPQLTDVFKNTSESAAGKLDVERNGTAVHVRGSLTSLMLGIVAAGSGL